MIDWSRAKELHEEVGAEDFSEVVEIFLEEVEGVIEKLRSPDLATLEQDLHFLKGSALNLGFRQFSRLCQEGERRSAQGEAKDVDTGAIISSYENSKEEFLRDMSSQL
ncbi:Hpt domain-containing protein [Phaeobacter sp. LSS9]|uniref:Hpt domain-containing protein n=1 Tax=unclassified Phaeobacter TaxID=2621772 RepID=UPI000E4E4B17|nr:Hpt domain-containing protein [Phaeobacter sp. LSS9]AXT35715.1 Hpt domain-containing protein [Phaeobacter sp. LSS9]